MAKPSIPKGTRDFSPVEMAKRNYIFDTIRSVYALYGFQQIETPAMETLLCRLRATSYSTARIFSFRSSATRFSRYGVPTVRRRAAIASSISVTPTL